MIRPHDPGLLVVIEGIDGAGKSTLARQLADSLQTLGFHVVPSREPTHGPHGRKLRESAASIRLPPNEELELFLLDRHDHVHTLILPNLAQGAVVLLDRYYFSTAAYQGARGLDAREILARNETFAPEPDLLFLLDLPVDVALQRIQGRNGQGDAFEGESYLRKVQQIFQSLQKTYLHHLDAQQSTSVNLRQILEVLLPLADQRKTPKFPPSSAGKIAST